MMWRKARAEEVQYVCENLRPEDDQEALAAYGVRASKTLPLAFHLGEADTLFAEDGTPFGLAGVAQTQDPKIGQVWMVSTPLLFQNQMRFLRNCEPWFLERLEKNPVLFNWVDARQEVHLRWLRWSGFSAIDYKPTWGVAGIPFYEMTRIR